MRLKEKLYDLKKQRTDALAEARALAEDGKGGEEVFAEKMAVVDKLGAEIAGVEKLLEAEKANADDAMKADETLKELKKAVAQDRASDGEGESYDKAVKAFADAARAGFKASPAKDYNNEGSDPDGGYTVPEDILTRVEQYRESKSSLRDLVSVETVSTNRGRRTFKQRSQQTGFGKVAEGGKIGQKGGPKFTVLAYEIEKYGGFLPVTNELLEDSDANIVQLLVEWIGDEARVTDNNLILEQINTKETVNLGDLDGIRKAALVDLDRAFRPTTKIITNSNGIYWLGTLKDGNGRDLLTPIPNTPGKLQLACGAVVIPVEELSNADMPNDGDKIPFVIGDLKEGIRLFDRRQLTITSSSVAMAGDFNAFEQDMTLTKATERLDVKVRDAEAFVNGYIVPDSDGDADAPVATLGVLTVTSTAGTDTGFTKLTVSPAKAEGNVYKYKVGDAAAAVAVGQNVTSWSVWDGTADLTVATGKVITLVEASADYKAVKAGSVTVTAKE